MQSKKHSMIETVVGTAVAFVISALLQYYVVTPLFDLPKSVSSSLGITVFFTVISLVRSYYWRRLCNWYFHRSAE